jgi:hypothetical protein
MIDQTHSTTVCVTVCLAPEVATTLARAAVDHHCSVQAELRAAVNEHLATQRRHSQGEGAGCWACDVAQHEAW